MSCRANESPMAMEDPTRNPVAVEPKIWPGSVVGELLLSRTTVATEDAAAAMHKRRLAANHMLLKASQRRLDGRGLISETISHPSSTNISASRTDDRTAGILTEVSQSSSDWARTQWTTRIAVVARAAATPRTVGTTRVTNMFRLGMRPGATNSTIRLESRACIPRPSLHKRTN